MKDRKRSLLAYGGVLTLAVAAYAIGHVHGRYVAFTSNVYATVEPIRIATAAGNIGVIPEGAELHRHSASHGLIRYFVFFEVPIEEDAKKVRPSEFDRWRGIKFMRSDSPHLDR